MFLVMPDETKTSIEKFMKKESLHIPVLMDNGRKVSRLFGVWAQPTTYLIDRHGMVRYRVMGAQDWTGTPAMNAINHLLEEK